MVRLLPESSRTQDTKSFSMSQPSWQRAQEAINRVQLYELLNKKTVDYPTAKRTNVGYKYSRGRAQITASTMMPEKNRQETFIP